jgi:hypothetical protein
MSTNEKLLKDKQNADATQMFMQVSLMFKDGHTLIKKIYNEHKNALTKDTQQNIEEYLQRSEVITENISKTATTYGL